jgi:hypothetical protein
MSKMILRLTRIPVGFGENRILGLVGKKTARLQDRKVGVQPVLTIEGGDIESIITLLDHGFGIELIEWSKR